MIGYMISFVEGAVEFKGEKFVVVKTQGGVGYKIFISAEAFKKIPEKGEEVKLWTSLYVREDALELYGFSNISGLGLFEMLIHVSGIGPKTALGVMGVAPIDTLKKAIAAGDTSYLTRVSGIGRKTAEKIVLELRDKMSGKGVIVEAPELKEEADALEALVSLGYSSQEARDALARVSEKTQGVEKRVAEALKQLGKRK